MKFGKTSDPLCAFIFGAGFLGLFLVKPAVADGPECEPMPPMPPPMMTPPPMTMPTPPVITVPTSPFPTTPPIVVPTDVTQTTVFPVVPIQTGLASPAIQGIEVISKFPPINTNQDDNSKIFVFPKENSVNVNYKKLSPALVDLEEGEILVSVRKPAIVGHIETKFGIIAVLANSDVIIRFDSKVLRITNADATGKRLRVALNKGPFANNKTILSIKPGYELVLGVNKLTRSDMKPNDGIARRHFQALDNGHMAISEVSIASLMKSSDLLASVRQNSTGITERRILSDMSKMAAVLNHINGTQGFQVTE